MQNLNFWSTPAGDNFFFFWKKNWHNFFSDFLLLFLVIETIFLRSYWDPPHVVSSPALCCVHVCLFDDLWMGKRPRAVNVLHRLVWGAISRLCGEEIVTCVRQDRVEVPYKNRMIHIYLYMFFGFLLKVTYIFYDCRTLHNLFVLLSVNMFALKSQGKNLISNRLHA
jgi:hypothetical protein